MEDFLKQLQAIGTNAGLKILLALVILVVGIKLSKWLIKLIKKGKAFSKLEKGAQSFITSFIRIALYALVIATAAMCCGVPSTAFLTIFTSAGVAIGLALQGALSNFAGGLMILFRHHGNLHNTYHARQQGHHSSKRQAHQRQHH